MGAVTFRRRPGRPRADRDLPPGYQFGMAGHKCPRDRQNANCAKHGHHASWCTTPSACRPSTTKESE